jgi:hypothetical protein
MRFPIADLESYTFCFKCLMWVMYIAGMIPQSPSFRQGNISDPRLMSQSGECTNTCVHRSVHSFSQISGVASIRLFT